MSIKQTGGAMIKGFKNLDDVIFVIHESKDNSIIIFDDETNLLIRLSLETDPQSISLSGYNITFSYDNMRINGDILYAITGIDKTKIEQDTILAAILGTDNISKLMREQKSSTTKSDGSPLFSVPQYINPRQRYKIYQINGEYIYFEQQDSPASCGRHAINNLLQMNPRNMYTKQMMMEFCLYLSEQNKLETEIKNQQLLEQGKYEEVVDSYQCRDNENYTDQTLIKVMEQNGYNTTVILPIHNPYIQLSMYTDNSLFLINLGNFMDVNNWRQNTSMRHWTAARKIGNYYYYFDSLHDSPDRFNNKDELILYLYNLTNNHKEFFIFN